MHRVLWIVLVVVFDFSSAFTLATAEEPPATKPLSAEMIEKRLEGDFGVDEIAATSGWVQSIGIVDWLGPLAPVALSPFFGVTCLSGLAIWGPDWVTDNALLGAAGPLQNPTLFAVFLGLTLLTSLPRLTKVSKPFAQAVDRIETYAVIVILLVIKGVTSLQDGSTPEVALVQLGVFSFTADTLLGLAMVANILVINSVKFFFEFMVWLTPIPLIDAIFEVCNKTLCAFLMAVYAFSPTLATVINLVVLLVAAIVLRWISRRVRFYRTMVLDPILAKLWSGFGQAKRPELIVFPKSDVGPFPAKSRLKLLRATDSAKGLVLEEANWWLPSKRHQLVHQEPPKICRGWVMNTIEIQLEGTDPTVLSFSRRYDDLTLRDLLTQLGIKHETTDAKAQCNTSRDFLAHEFL